MLHSQLIKETGGSDGLRDERMLDSALQTPFQGFGNTDLYPGIPAKAARLCYGLVKKFVLDIGYTEDEFSEAENKMLQLV